MKLKYAVAVHAGQLAKGKYQYKIVSLHKNKRQAEEKCLDLQKHSVLNYWRFKLNEPACEGDMICTAGRKMPGA